MKKCILTSLLLFPILTQAQYSYSYSYPSFNRYFQPQQYQIPQSYEIYYPTAKTRYHYDYYKPKYINSPYSTEYNSYRRGSQKLTAGSRDVLFYDSYFNGRVGIEVEGVTFQINSNSKVSDKNNNNKDNELSDFNQTFTNFRLLVDGRQIDRQNYLISNGSDNNPQNYELIFDSRFELHPNSHIVVTGKIQKNSKSGDKIKLLLRTGGFHSPEYLSNRNSIDPDDIRGGGNTKYIQVR